jgi:diaminohydroxyphosphoribosylaminopyrimidine deaminase / 5-amino-6-(5-phosphoribosylamino)uracil reductase
MDDADLMRRAIELAIRGRGRVEPNPMVGCVLVRDGRVIGEGYHEYFGGPHAEANALAKCADAAGATAYVTLEPCCHTNKKTPPCTSALIAAKVSRVAAACADPNPPVAGKGFAEIQNAGINVETGLLEGEAKQLNAAYFKLLSQRRPYVTLKWAQTADRRIAGAGGKRLAISDAASLEAVHRLRSRCDGILVGIGTVLADDPVLKVRVANPSRVPVRIVLDSELRIPLESQLAKTAAASPVLVCSGEKAVAQKAELVSELKSRGVDVLPIPTATSGGLSLTYLLEELGARKMTHLLVEPGARLARSFLRENLADRVWIFRSPMRVDEGVLEPAKVEYPKTGAIDFDGDELSEYLNPKGAAFYSMQKSTDLRLEELSRRGLE